jgi:RNA recognition motif-containing protein
VEYATREQAQNAVNTLSNQNLMGRLVYVREDREPEPRFTGGPGRGDFGGAGRGGFGGAYGGGGGGGRQLYVANVGPSHRVIVDADELTSSSFPLMLAGKI